MTKNFFTQLKEITTLEIIKLIILGLSLLTLAVLGNLGFANKEALYQKVQLLLHSKIELWIAIILCIILLIIGSWLYKSYKKIKKLKVRIKNKLRVIPGIYCQWDLENNPYCATCYPWNRSLLYPEKQDENTITFVCHICKRHYEIQKSKLAKENIDYTVY